MTFEFVEPDGAVPLPLCAGDWLGDQWTFAHNAMCLAEAATMFYVGAYPLESPHFPWGKWLALPWREQYPDSKQITDEVAAIAELIVSVEQFEKGAYGASGFVAAPWPLSERRPVQALAVEALLCVDRAIAELSAGQHLAAALWLSSAHMNITECTAEAQLLLGIASLNARTAADASHAEDRACKRQVLEWLHEHPEKPGATLDDTAEAVLAARLNTMKRSTIKGYIREYRKSLLNRPRPPVH